MAKFNDAFLTKIRQLVGASQFNDNQTLIYITGPFGDDKITSGINGETKQGIIIVENFDETNDMLSIFGDMVYNIVIYFQNIAVEQSKEIVKHINEHCSATLKTLRLLNCSGNVLDDLDNKFTNVSLLTFTTHPTEEFQTTAENIKFNETFPNLVTLNTFDAKHSVKAHDWKFIHGYYPNLKKLTVQASNAKMHDHLHIIKFLQLNSHIETITIKHSSLKLWHQITQLLSNLQRIEFLGISQDFTNHKCDTLNFESVKHFLFESLNANDFPEKVSVLQVETLELNIPFNFTVKWMEFCSKQVNKNLRSFTVDTNYLAREHFLQISKQFDQLINVTIKCKPTYFVADDIVAFLRQSTNLVKLEMEIRLTASEQKLLQETLEGQWFIASELRRSKQNVEDLVFLKFAR